ncbi:hypothetical protein L202_00486 [Cryptococcus amylolentus CBS 6039]|uniref:Glycoside hydrolase family 2 protein n=1 Tax=Cryptococcus amylolentus CBS 6039 TaxID=1295533 RepID=A0A1E3I7E4_9TREE|nr:hypothetical protein L202_00486 [Cryptococcus amylolentus CBS 6039]ODN84559.1 hypothetical protein L202_00486 [Cryptococcus amylolentus CBS 6039]
MWMRTVLLASLGLVVPSLAQYDPSSSGYSVKTPPLSTDWTDKVGTDPWTEYPRPQQVRDKWQSLNGIWRYEAASSLDDVHSPPTGKGESFGAPIMIPSCLESALSGVMAEVGSANLSWFQTTFKVPSDWQGDNVVINFGAVDYQATVIVNGNNVTAHTGGYNRFWVEISEHVNFGEDNELLVFVHDPTDSNGYVVPVGKQTNIPSHIFYTPCSGIWQSVFIEPVPKTYIDKIDLSGDMWGVANITVHSSDNSFQSVKVSVLDENASTLYEGNGTSDTAFTFTVPNVSLWSPSSPKLYNVTVALGDDSVDTYIGFRTVERGTVQAVTRPLLNGDFFFAFGPLDQGFWPDGLYTPPNHEAMVYDLQFLKDLGFNMVRKHIKVETDLFYRACDEIGLLVMQDMPSFNEDLLPNDEQQAQFESQLEEMVQLHKSFPSIYAWVIYNEGWGQLDRGPEVEITPRLQSWDPTRLVNSVTGWHDHGAGDFLDDHHYVEPQCGMANASGPSSPYDPDRIGFQGEFGGLGHNVSIDHLWNVPEAIAAINETYEIDKTIDEWNSRAHTVLGILESQIKDYACSGGVWTQTTDVEGEINGLMTYDRRVKRTVESQWKSDIQALYKAAAARGGGDGIGPASTANDTASSTVLASQPSESVSSSGRKAEGGGVLGLFFGAFVTATFPIVF